MPSQRQSPAAGFTLIELLASITLLMLLVSLSIPATGFFNHFAAERVARQLSGAFRLAYAEAQLSNEGVYLCATQDFSSCSSDQMDWSTGWIVYRNKDANSQYTIGVDALIKTYPEAPEQLKVGPFTPPSHYPGFENKKSKTWTSISVCTANQQNVSIIDVILNARHGMVFRSTRNGDCI